MTAPKQHTSRTRRETGRRVRAAALGLCTGLGLLLGAATLPAHANDEQHVTAHLTYDCRASGYIDVVSVGVVVDMWVPAHAKPGDSLELEGTMVVRFPSWLGLAAEHAGLTHVVGSTDEVRIPATITGETTLLPTGTLSAPRTRIADPLMISTSFRLPSLAVPEESWGEVVVQGPANGSTTNPDPTADPVEVAFTASATVSGATYAERHRLYCWSPEGADRVIARIPISPDGDAAPASDPEPAASPSAPPIAFGEAGAGVGGGVEVFRVSSTDAERAQAAGGSAHPFVIGGVALAAVLALTTALNRIRIRRRLTDRA